jgi:hypothetical protein
MLLLINIRLGGVDDSSKDWDSDFENMTTSGMVLDGTVIQSGRFGSLNHSGAVE